MEVRVLFAASTSDVRHDATLTPAQKTLVGYMHWWSEDRYRAGWLVDLEQAMVGDDAYDWLVIQAGGTFTYGPRA